LDSATFTESIDTTDFRKAVYATRDPIQLAWMVNQTVWLPPMATNTPVPLSPPSRQRRLGGERGGDFSGAFVANQSDSPTAQGRRGLGFQRKVALSN
jgi:hypothetical protein